MNKTLKVFISIIVMIISIGIVCITIGYEKTHLENNELVFLDELDNKLYNTNNIGLTHNEIVIIFLFILVFAIALLYFINIMFNLFNFDKLYKKAVVCLVLFTFASVSTQILVAYTNKYILVSKNSEFIKNPYHTSIISPNGKYEITSDNTIENKKYIVVEPNTNAVLIRGGIKATLNSILVVKQGNSSNNTSSTVYGTNSAILVLKDSYLSLNNSTINTSGEGASGLFAALENSKIEANMVNIETSNNDSIGVVASINSLINIKESKIKTSSKGSSGVSAIRGGTINIYSTNIKTTAPSSPLISNNSVVSINNSTGDANGSPVLYTKGSSNTSIFNCEFKTTGNRITSNNYDGAFIIDNQYLSNGFEDTSKLSIYNSTITIKNQSKVYDSAPMILINNSNTDINLSNNTFDYGSNIFLKLQNSSKSKNMRVVLNGSNQVINGNIVVSNNSVLEINLTNSQFKGNINKNNKADKLSLVLNDSTLELTDDSYVSTLVDNKEDFSNIKSNGYTLYYDKELNKNFDGKTFKLSDGGYVKPYN